LPLLTTKNSDRVVDVDVVVVVDRTPFDALQNFGLRVHRLNVWSQGDQVS
jgi:hypothetical protein